MTDRSPINVSIYGSCVTRDMLNVVGAETYNLKRYVARQSLVSAFSTPIKTSLNLNRLPSEFQKRMVEGDSQGSLLTAVEAAAQDSDCLLWDLTDERLGVYQVGESSYVTRSIELISSGIDQDLKESARHIAFGTRAHYLLWTRALHSFNRLLLEHSMATRTFLFRIPWAIKNDRGQIIRTTGLAPDRANRLYRRYMNAASSQIKSVTLLKKEVTAAVDHQWGPAPYHYTEQTYETMSSRLVSMMERG